jgi:Fe-S-cluster containining protein
MVKKFECKMCGNCCRNMRGRTERKSPVYPPYWFSAVPLLEKTLLLLEWEIPVLQERARQLSIELKVVPDDMIWDDVSNVPIVLQWNLDHNDCPFLSENNHCLVNENKPLCCQAYPLMSFGMLKDLDVPDVPKNIVFIDCPNIVPIAQLAEGKMMRVRSSTIFKRLFQSYGSAFIGMLRLDAAVMFYSECLKDLVKEWIVYPGIIDEKVMKSLLEEKPVGLLEHLKRKAPNKAKELEKSIREIYDFDSTTLAEIIAQGTRKLHES